MTRADHANQIEIDDTHHHSSWWILHTANCDVLAAAMPAMFSVLSGSKLFCADDMTCSSSISGSKADDYPMVMPSFPEYYCVLSAACWVSNTKQVLKPMSSLALVWNKLSPYASSYGRPRPSAMPRMPTCHSNAATSSTGRLPGHAVSLCCRP